MTDRFRIARGKMLVIAPNEAPTFRAVKLIYDTENEMVGLQLIGDSQLKGWCFYVRKADYDLVETRGKPVDVVRVE